jgi:hypothetical protein
MKRRPLAADGLYMHEIAGKKPCTRKVAGAEFQA